MGGGEASRYDVVVFGVYFCDLIFTGLEEMPKLGTELYSSALDVTVGGPFNTVLALHRLGSRVGWSCDFGDDFFSRFVLDYVRNEGLDDALFRVHPFPVRSVTVAASLPQDRAFITYADHRDAPLPVPLVQRHRPRAVFLPDLPHGEEARGLYAAAREASCVVHGGLADGEIMLGTPGVEEALRSLDVFTPNLDEALRLTDAGSAEEAVETLAALAPTVAVKLGAEGAIGRRGGRTARVPAIDVDPFDTTGAGDCFDAGFLHGHLRGDSLEDCLRLGNVCGGLATTATGSRATPSLAEAKRRLAEHYPKTAQRAALKEAQER
jgi:sugar/nucleoside kinase (ribokinase family)